MSKQSYIASRNFDPPSNVRWAMPCGAVGSGPGETARRGIGDPDLSDEELAITRVKESGSGEEVTRWRSRLEGEFGLNAGDDNEDAFRGSDKSRCTVDSEES